MWLDRTKPDILMMQETKLADADAPNDVFRQSGYELVHHGQGRWNGVAIASRCGIESVLTNFGERLRPAPASETGDDEPMAEARMISADCGGVRVVCVYAPNGRVVDSPFYAAKLEWFDRLSRWLEESIDPNVPAIIGGDLNVAPEDIDVWDPQACHGGTHVSEPERKAFARLCREAVRVGTMDLKIACIAITHEATLLTRNTIDFAKVPGLRFENWLD